MLSASHTDAEPRVSDWFMLTGGIRGGKQEVAPGPTEMEYFRPTELFKQQVSWDQPSITWLLMQVPRDMAVSGVGVKTKLDREGRAVSKFLKNLQQMQNNSGK